jgi:hypothetical protein
MVAALIVSGAVPEEVSVTDCVVGVLMVTLPNAKLAALTLRAGVLVAPADWALSSIAKLCVLPAAVAVSVAVCEELTGVTLAVNEALAAFAGTVTLVGTDTAELSVARFTETLLLPAELSVTVQASLSLPVIVESTQERALTVAAAALFPPVAAVAAVYV